MGMTIAQEFRKIFGKRKKDSHKGDYGKIFILAGSRGFTGAAFLAGMGASRAGAGLVTVGVPESVYTIIARRSAELMVRPFPSTKNGSLSLKGRGSILKFLGTQDVFALGPGLSQDKETQKLIRALVLASRSPIVLDADGLNAFKGKPALFRRVSRDVVLTPHPGEFVRIFGGRRPQGDSERKKRAEKAAKLSGAHVVLKGRHTVVASPNGKTCVNRTGNPGMATGGIGDVLTGIVAAFLGRGLTAFDAARMGVFIHGVAGDLAVKDVGEDSLIATDLLNALPRAFRKVKGT